MNPNDNENRDGGFNPLGTLPPTNANWFDIWNDWAWNAQDDNLFTSSGNSQFGQWSQQMVSTMYQNWYNSAPEQMKRAIEAGINPFTAASGIAGSDPGSVASPPPQGKSQFPEALSSIGSLASSLGGAFGSVASGVSTALKLTHEISKLDAETASLFEGLGFTKLQSKALSVQLKYLDQKEQVGVWQALASFNKTQQEYRNLSVNHANILAQYDEIIAHKDLLVAQKGEVEAQKEVDMAMKSKLEQEAKWQQIENEFFEAHHYKLGTPLYESLRDMMVEGVSFDMDSYGDIVSGYEGKLTSAVESAKAQESWNYRPSNAYEAASFIGRTIGTNLRTFIMSNSGVSSWSEFFNKLNRHTAARQEFDQAYEEARDALQDTYLQAKRYYNHIKRGGNTQEVARAKNARDNAYNELKLFTKEKFSQTLVDQISPR